MDGNWRDKVLVFLLVVPGILIVGFIVMVMVALSGGARFYSTFIMTMMAVLIAYLIFRLFVPIRPRIMNMALIVMIILAGLTVTGFELNRAYHNSISTVSEQGVVISEYEPFQNNSKIAILEQPASLALQTDLPRLDGATALYPLYSAFAQAVYPEKRYDPYDSEVMVNTTPAAYTHLMTGKVDVIFVAGPSARQLEEAEQKGVELKLTPIGREAFVFFVNAENPVKGLTTEQIQNIYSGQITNWDEVGGNKEKIRPFQRPEGSGSQTMLQKIMIGKTIMSPSEKDFVSGMGEIIEQTADYKNYKSAMGYSFLFFATEMVQNGNIRLLEVDGVAPNRNTIRSEEYPLAAEFYAVTRDDEHMNPNVDKLIEWILSPQGQELVEKTGYTGISK
ncbi:Phosphate-binding protein PstS 1 precursor [compost metagenome]